MASTPIRLPVAYPIGFFKGSEDLFNKFNGQGDKWQMDIFTAPENKKLFLNPSAVKAGKDAKSVVGLRYDCMEGKNGLKAQLQVDTTELWNGTLAYNFDMGGDGHRALASFGYATRDAESGRRQLIPGDKPHHARGTVGYRVTSKDFQVQAEVDQGKNWQTNGIFSFPNGAFGFKLNQGAGKAINVDAGFGYVMDAIRGYIKVATSVDNIKPQVTLLAHPLNNIAGVSCVAKAELDTAKPKNVGVTFSGASPLMSGQDWKLNLKATPAGDVSLATALVTKLPNKWVMGFSAGFADAKNLGDLSQAKLGVRLIQGSTPLPL